MTSDEIRELFLGFFEERDHLRLPSEENFWQAEIGRASCRERV